MRIPSQLNRESLYRQKNQRQSSTENYRRIIRLCLGLALVLLVMKQAAKPGVYQVFFDPSDSGQPLVRPLNAGSDPSKPASAQLSPVMMRDIESASNLSLSEREIGEKLATSLQQSDQQLWLKSLLEWQAGKDNASVPSSVESLREELENISKLPTDAQEENQVEIWLQAIDTLPPRNLDLSTPDTPVDLKRIALLTALDNQATSRVVDGSVWRSGDFDSLYSFLYQSPQAPRQNTPRLGVLPLLQQPQIYRNQWVQIKGEVARVDRVETPDNPYEIQEYWQIWLRPLNGTNRPMVAIVPQIPKVVYEIEDKSSIENGPELVVTGRYLKRLSYQSGIGADLAPVIVGEIRSAPLHPSVATKLPAAAESPPIPVLWITLFAIGLGLAVSLLIMWNTEKAAKKTRNLRLKQNQKTLPELSWIDHSNQQAHSRE